MEKEFKAKTVEEAKAYAELEFGVCVDEIDFEILEQPMKSLFGLKGEARVKAIYTPAAAAPAEEPHEAPAPAASAEESADIADEDSYDEEEGALPEDFDVNSSAKVKAAIEYLTDVLHALKLENFAITPIMRNGNVVLDISGEKLGVVIGKRGETLDSLQYLTILASNRTEESYCRISIDCNGYRDKRRETLETLAKRTSQKVIKQGRKIALEPMNPYERRIIHSCVAEIEGVSSHSTGTEPYRKVVIYADKPKYDNRRRSNSGRRQGGGVKNYKQSGGFSTSFEREYKRRSYEPDENADAGAFSKETVDTEKNATLYGKIEL
ncbi:MAG: KH domain-containing protein [Oscillospiraceae bacterium]|nr:KH domain-containing protein [Oscillospiraceae bacterium]